jgi:hypothetical protein
MESGTGMWCQLGVMSSKTRSKTAEVGLRAEWSYRAKRACREAHCVSNAGKKDRRYFEKLPGTGEFFQAQ